MKSRNTREVVWRRSFAAKHKNDWVVVNIELSTYLSITGEVYGLSSIPGEKALICPDGKKRWLHSCGQCCEAIVAAHPWMVPYMRWHLCDADDGPMHYVQNAVYWLQQAYGVAEYMRDGDDIHAARYFRKHVVFGAVEGDEMPKIDLNPHDAYDELDMVDARAHIEAVVVTWCLERRPKLLDAYNKAIGELEAMESTCK